jgi:hypothetical protein
MSEQQNGCISNESLYAFLDGELRDSQRARVQAHLETCPACQQEIQAMKALQSLLQQDPLPVELPSAEALASSVLRRIPSQPAPALPRTLRELLWWSAPLVILGGWLFLQVTYKLSNWLWWGGQLGILGGGFSSLLSQASGQSWLSATLGRFIQLPSELGLAGSLGASLWVQLNWQIMLFILYLTWLVVWWLRYQRQWRPVSE